jgi:hypothetical protein
VTVFIKMAISCQNVHCVQAEDSAFYPEVRTYREILETALREKCVPKREKVNDIMKEQLCARFVQYC